MLLMKKFRVLMVTILILTLITPAAALAESNSLTEMNEVFQLLEKNHVSGVKGDQLSLDAINGMIDALGDPYTEYFTADEWQSYEGALNQAYVGVGMRLTQDMLGFRAVEVFANSPAEAGGIMEGDYIISVDDEQALELTLQELVDLIVGPEGTEVYIVIQREDQTLTLKCIRAQVHAPAVYAQTFDGGVGYIELSSFSETAGTEFINALAKMEANGVQALIIDLRGNPGGYLHIVGNIAEQFIEEGILIHTRDRDGINASYEIGQGKSATYPIVILVDEHSASASEILAGALQDYNLATIIGSNTYGKGSVQRLVPLSTGSVLKITLEEYLTPDQHPVNAIGIKPDIEITGKAAQMLTALHAVGLHHIELNSSKNAVQINGVSVDGLLDHVIEQDKVYVHSRLLASLVDGSISWNGETQAVDIVTKHGKRTFDASSASLKLISGKSYVELDEFKRAFPQIDWSINEDIIRLSHHQRNELH